MNRQQEPERSTMNPRDTDRITTQTLLKRIILEAQAFSRPASLENSKTSEGRERRQTDRPSIHSLRSSELSGRRKQRKPSATATAIPARSGTSSDLQRHQQ